LSSPFVILSDKIAGNSEGVNDKKGGHGEAPPSISEHVIAIRQRQRCNPIADSSAQMH
jgi:hypothetical protein